MAKKGSWKIREKSPKNPNLRTGMCGHIAVCKGICKSGSLVATVELQRVASEGCEGWRPPHLSVDVGPPSLSAVRKGRCT